MNLFKIILLGVCSFFSLSIHSSQAQDLSLEQLADHQEIRQIVEGLYEVISFDKKADEGNLEADFDGLRKLVSEEMVFEITKIKWRKKHVRELSMDQFEDYAKREFRKKRVSRFHEVGVFDKTTYDIQVDQATVYSPYITKARILKLPFNFLTLRGANTITLEKKNGRWLVTRMAWTE